MTSLPERIDSILLQYRAELKQGLNELAGHGTPEEQARTQINLLLEEVIDEVLPKKKIDVEYDEIKSKYPDLPKTLPDVYEAGFNQARAEIKNRATTILKGGSDG
jgi:hypothetical protein